MYAVASTGLVKDTYDIGCRLLSVSAVFREAGEKILLAAKELSDAEDAATCTCCFLRGFFCYRADFFHL